MNPIDDLLAKHRKKIIDREEKTFREILAAYIEIEKEIQAKWKQLAATWDGDGPPPIAWYFERQRLANLLESLKKEIVRFGGKINPVIEREQKKAIDIAISNSKELFDLAKQPFTIAGDFSRRALENAVGLLGDGSPLLDYYREQLAPAVAEKIRSEIIKATALGTPFSRIATALQEAGDITRQRALSVARTEVNRVRRETNRDIYQENSDLVIGWEWVASKSTRTCVLCLAMDGTIFKLQDEFPQHVNCRCTIVPVFRDDQPRALLGADYFDGLSDEEKQSILGKDAFAAFQNGDILKLKDFVGWKTDKRFGRSVYRKPLAKILADK
jgi:SPP1 gp7 family putative phage head morphogenesis protein